MSTKFSLKKVASISVVAFTSILMLVVSVIPHHHHHNGKVHFINGKEHSHNHSCEIPSDRHQNDQAENSNCFVHSSFVVYFTDPESNNKIAGPELTEHHLFFPVIPDFFLKISALVSSNKINYGEYVCHYKSPKICLSNGLRAPPSLVS